MRSLMLEDYRTFGEFVLSYRIKFGLSQEDLAKLSNVSRVTISNIEKDLQSPHLKNAMEILSVLKSKGAPDIDLPRLLKESKKEEMQRHSEEREDDETHDVKPSPEDE